MTSEFTGINHESNRPDSPLDSVGKIHSGDRNKNGPVWAIK
ncbi:hypothetical protein QWZ16_05745 [Vibrio ostreicida]|uniref:Uncharacterized protein n=1 Tax=Vibrio ostreicida TaxID=526588 RepID=A0ABT8BPZ7_9VIBR|nr:hypothetical protein [Vibrio ostreicida]MDN3609227.1 hypothetical protein [Vibrio ostreicida]